MAYWFVAQNPSISQCITRRENISRVYLDRDASVLPHIHSMYVDFGSGCCCVWVTEEGKDACRRLQFNQWRLTQWVAEDHHPPKGKGFVKRKCLSSKGAIYTMTLECASSGLSVVDCYISQLYRQFSYLKTSKPAYSTGHSLPTYTGGVKRLNKGAGSPLRLIVLG